MIKFNQKIIFVFIFAVLAICACGGSVFAERGLEIDYPEVPGAEAPTEGTELPGYIKYIFNFSVMIGGILAFAVLLYGGIRWMTSVGNPAAISDAKSWMLGGIMGLFLLLCTYLILITINPQLAIFGKMKPLVPVIGIYLINGEGKKKHITTDFSDIKDFDTVSIEFIDSPDELTSVFIYKNKNNKAATDAEIMEIKNGQPIPNFGFVPASILFFWNKPGVYLYEKTDFEINKRPPKYISDNEPNLGDWNNKTKSLKFNPENKYGTVLFTENEFKGECGFAYYLNASDLSDAAGAYYFNPIGLETLSSVILLDIKESTSGSITFYDSIDCKGNEKIITPEGVMILEDISDGEDCSLGADECCFEGTGGTTGVPCKELNEDILSFKIDGNFDIALNTETGFLGKCQIFKKPKNNDCIPTIKGSYIYDPEPDGKKVKSIIIVPI